MIRNVARRIRTATCLSSAALLGVLGGCATDAVEDDAESASEAALTENEACAQPASFPNAPLAAIQTAEGKQIKNQAPFITNYTAWPQYGARGAYDANIVKARSAPAEALKNIVDRFGTGCAAKVDKHLKTKKPNVYVYFTGFGGATQDNSVVDEGGILRWINQRDPKALIFSINWSCENSHDAWCKTNADKLKIQTNSPEYQAMTRTVQAVAPQAMGTVQQILAQTDANQQGYNSALSHGMQLATLLVDQLLVADQAANIGDINFLGYSMGAHAASQILIQDFAGNGKGFKWSRAGVCANGSDTCTVAELSKVKWALSMGLSGWSEALLSYNKGRSAEANAQFQNGGLFRVKDARFKGKLAVFNRRMDPTGNSDDTFERGFGDLFFSDYNHYSHDYSLPTFVSDERVKALDAFLENPASTDSLEYGILADNAGRVDFDDCAVSGACKASTDYLAHSSNRSHGQINLVHTAEVATTDGVKHPEKPINRAVTFAAPGAKALAMNTMDQEDLRGGVELYFRPQFDPAAAGTHGLFSYGDCNGSGADLMPQAYVQDGKLNFTMKYQGADYPVSIPVADAKLKKGQWTHLAFTWELPVVSLADVTNPTFAESAGTYGQAIVLAAGLRKPLPTTYKRQQGKGEMRIFVNGELAQKAALGTDASTRECLAAQDLLSKRPYSVDDGQYPAFNPYANYSTDDVSIGGPSLGKKCKAYKVRNEQVFFGCAKSPTANASGDMDDLMIVWGPGRTNYENIDHATGKPKVWPVGTNYGPKRFVAR